MERVVVDKIVFRFLTFPSLMKIFTMKIDSCQKMSRILDIFSRCQILGVGPSKDVPILSPLPRETKCTRLYSLNHTVGQNAQVNKSHKLWLETWTAIINNLHNWQCVLYIPDNFFQSTNSNKWIEIFTVFQFCHELRKLAPEDFRSAFPCQRRDILLSYIQAPRNHSASLWLLTKAVDQ